MFVRDLKDCASRAHKLKTSEVYYILEGEGLMHIDDEIEPVHDGHIIYIPPDSTQFFQNTGKRRFDFHLYC